MSFVNRRDLQFLARSRLTEARALLSASHPDGAYYLAGYAVECGLKACIARRTERHEFPDKRTVDASHTHNLRDLVKVANLSRNVWKRQRAILFFATTGMSCSSGRNTVVTGGTMQKWHKRWSKRLVTGNMG
jgi:hypothetical protein